MTKIIKIINKKDSDGITILMYAIKNDKIEICKMLIDNGADLNSKDNNGKTPLMYAIINNNIKICEMLINKGVNK